MAQSVEQLIRNYRKASVAFIEGGPIYDGAGFHAKTHIQLCVRNVAQIKGYFRPLGEDGKPLLFG